MMDAEKKARDYMSRLGVCFSQTEDYNLAVQQCTEALKEKDAEIAILTKSLTDILNDDTKQDVSALRAENERIEGKRLDLFALSVGNAKEIDTLRTALKVGVEALKLFDDHDEYCTYFTEVPDSQCICNYNIVKQALKTMEEALGEK